MIPVMIEMRGRWTNFLLQVDTQSDVTWIAHRSVFGPEWEKNPRLNTILTNLPLGLLDQRFGKTAGYKTVVRMKVGLS